MGVKGVHAMVNGDTNVGLEFGFRMMVIAISIAMGLFAASVLMYKHKVSGYKHKISDEGGGLTFLGPQGLIEANA